MQRRIEEWRLLSAKKSGPSSALLGLKPSFQSASCTQPGLPLEKMPEGKSFTEHYKKRYNNAEVQIYAPYAYDAASALIEAMKATGSADPAKYGPAIGKVNFPGVSGKIAFDAQGDIKDGAVTVYQYKGGKWVAL